jgi:hypothetical protein
MVTIGAFAKADRSGFVLLPQDALEVLPAVENADHQNFGRLDEKATVTRLRKDIVFNPGRRSSLATPMDGKAARRSISLIMPFVKFREIAGETSSETYR